MSSLGFPYGFAIRRHDSCASSETDCGSTWGDYHVCCPGSSQCGKNSTTSTCCPSDDLECEGQIRGNFHCADDTALLYFANNFFCCPDGMTAFKQVSNGYVGCTDDTSSVMSNDAVTTVPSISTSPQTTATTATSATSTTIASTSATTTPAAASTSSTASGSGHSGSSSHTGAIAGGVVGGVVGAALLVALAWFLYRRNRHVPVPLQSSQGPPTSELEGSSEPTRSELDSSIIRQPPSTSAPSELPAHMT